MVSDETRGVPLVEHHTLSFAGRPRYFTAAEDETPTHTAYSVAEARLLEAVAGAAERFQRAIENPHLYLISFERDRLMEARDALAAHRKEQA